MADICSCGRPIRKGKFSRYCPGAFTSQKIMKDGKLTEVGMNSFDPYNTKHIFN